MRRPAAGSVFLARSSFRRRRMRDAGRMLPIISLIVVSLPLLKAGSNGALTSGVLIYLFVYWAVVVAAAGFLSRLSRGGPEPGADDEGPAP